MAAPRKNVKGDTPILWYLTGIRPGIRSASDSSSSLTMSLDFERGSHSACAVRGQSSRRALPCLRLSVLDKASADSILILLTSDVTLDWVSSYPGTVLNSPATLSPSAGGLSAPPPTCKRRSICRYWQRR